MLHHRQCVECKCKLSLAKPQTFGGGADISLIFGGGACVLGYVLDRSGTSTNNITLVLFSSTSKVSWCK